MLQVAARARPQRETDSDLPPPFFDGVREDAERADSRKCEAEKADGPGQTRDESPILDGVVDVRGHRNNRELVPAMNAVFVDTGGWMACADRADPAHGPCRAVRDFAIEKGQTLISTDVVIDETLTLIRFRLGLSAAHAWQQIDGSARLRWERVESDRFERARHLFFQYPAKDLSFTDCTSIAVMRELKLTAVITTDHQFRQVGFDVLPAARPGRPRKPRRS